MILAIDAQYSDSTARVCGVEFIQWSDRFANDIYTIETEVLEAYEPGQFYRRELPCILELLERCELAPKTIVVDGYVYLDGFEKPGLGKHLFDALDGRVNVIGVAKNRFRDMTDRFQVFRGHSVRPLYVTCEGLPIDAAKSLIENMHGNHRMPTLLKLADSGARNQS